jgi:peptidoglycan/xylan/chitin deacetylase (PgdA/CDA1 family)
MPWRGVRILGFHRVADERHDLAVRPRAFREQMELMLEVGLQPIKLERALDLLKAPVEGRYVCVTFDDGYRDNLEHAVPVLSELSIPATIFVPTAVIDGRATYTWFKRPPPSLTWEEIGELVAGGVVDVQAHTVTHVRLPQVGDVQAREEIFESKHELERHVPYEVTSFAYPAGLYGERDVDLVREAGYRGAVTTLHGVNPGGQSPYRLLRTLVYWQDRRGDFAVKLAGGLDRTPALGGFIYRRRSRA